MALISNNYTYAEEKEKLIAHNYTHIAIYILISQHMAHYNELIFRHVRLRPDAGILNFKNFTLKKFTFILGLRYQ